MTMPALQVVGRRAEAPFLCESVSDVESLPEALDGKGTPIAEALAASDVTAGRKWSACAHC